MDHKATANGLDRYTDAINYAKNTAHVPFFLGEVGSGMSNGKAIELSTSLGTALWTVDWMLLAMIRGVDRVYMQQLDGGIMSAWIPETPNGAAKVQSSYYGDIFVADLIGKEGNLKVARLGASSDLFSAYGVYNSDTLNKIALVNLKLYKSSDKERGTTSVHINLPAGVKSVHVDKLTGPSGDALENITYAGNEWTPASKGLANPVKNDSEDIKVDGNSVTVKVQDSEALLLSLHR